MSAVLISQREAFSDAGTGLLVFATLHYVNTGKQEECKDAGLCSNHLCL